MSFTAVRLDITGSFGCFLPALIPHYFIGGLPLIDEFDSKKRSASASCDCYIHAEQNCVGSVHESISEKCAACSRYEK